MSTANVFQYHGVDRYLVGGVSGLIAGFFAGGFMHFGRNLIKLLCALAPHVGPHPVVAIGWIVHIYISVLFGLLFTAIISSRPVHKLLNNRIDVLLMGIFFGPFLGLVVIGLLLPLAMRISGITAYPVPYLSVPSVPDMLITGFVFALGYMLYGLLWSGTFAMFNDPRSTTIVDRDVPGEASN